jgi:hypothetical protein
MTVAEHIEAEQSLADRLADYAGEWVAVVEHAVEAHASTLEALLEQIQGQEQSDIEVFRVPEDPHVACFY